MNFCASFRSPGVQSRRWSSRVSNGPRRKYDPRNDAVGKYIDHLYDGHLRWAFVVFAKEVNLGIYATQRVEGQFRKIKQHTGKSTTLSG